MSRQSDDETLRNRQESSDRCIIDEYGYISAIDGNVNDPCKVAFPKLLSEFKSLYSDRFFYGHICSRDLYLMGLIQNEVFDHCSQAEQNEFVKTLIELERLKAQKERREQVKFEETDDSSGKDIDGTDVFTVEQ